MGGRQVATVAERYPDDCAGPLGSLPNYPYWWGVGEVAYITYYSLK